MATAPTVPITDVWPQVSTGQVTFYWRAPASDGGDPITKYTLSCAAISYSQDVSATSLDFTVTGLTDKTDYVFQITATNAVGTSPAATFPVVQPGATPFGPTVATASTLNTSTALVSWTPSTLATEGALRAYVVQVIPSTPAISSYFITMFPFKSTMAVTGLSTNTYYQFLVRGINDVGYCPPFAYTSTLGFGITTLPFSPSSIGGMQLWLDANQITGLSNTQTLTSWTDRGPLTLSNTTSGSPSAPTYITNQMNGLPIVRFNGGYINLGSNLQIGTDPGQCIFTVLKFNETGSDVAIIGRNNEAVGRWALDRYQGTLRYYIQTPSGFAGADYTNNNNVSSQIINVSWDRAITSMYINAEVKYSSPFSSSDNIVNSSPVGIGAFIERPSGGPIWYMSADVAEVLYYNRGLTPFDRQKVEGYLAWKWGLNANLPALHPFKLAAPINTSVFSPSSFSGLQLWLDAADATTITLTGSNVTGWADKSGANTTMNTFAGNPITVSSNALNSKSVLTFSQSYIFGKPSTVYTGDSMTAFMIGRMNNSAQYTTVLTMGRSNIDAATNSNSAGMFVLDYPSTRFDTARNNVYNRYNFDSNAYFLASAIQIPATSYMGINGGSFSNATTGTSANFNISTIVVGNNTIPDNLNVLSGNIGEMLVYFRQLSVEDCQTVEGYLAWKWGLQGSLPTAHPYKSQNPASLVSPTPYFATNFNNGNDANLINYASSNLSTNTVTSTGYSYRIQSNTMNSQTYMNNTNTVSYCASIYCTETNGSYMGVLFSRQADNNNACGIHLIGSNIGYHWITDYNFGIVVPLNTWMHVVVTISPTDAKIYINGTLSNTRTNAHSSVNLSSFYVGADPYVFSDRSFRGLIDNVAVYNTTLDAATISSIYARTLLV